MSTTTEKTQHLEKIAELVKNTRIAMLTTLNPNGHFHSRPMATMDVEFDGTVWFFTAKSSPKVQEIEADSRVNVAYSNPEKQNYVSLAGRAELVLDRALNEKYWNPAFEAWFKDGLDDPELSLLKIEIESAEYWDSPSSVVAHVSGFVKNKLLGQTPDVGDHAKIEL